MGLCGPLRTCHQTVDDDLASDAGGAVAIGHLGVFDNHLLNVRHDGQSAVAGVGRRRLGRFAELPVSRPGGIGLDQNIEARQQNPGDPGLAGQQGDQFDLGFEAPEFHHLRARSPLGVGQRHPFEPQGWGKGNRQIEIARDDQLAPGRLERLFGDEFTVLVEVERLQDGDAGGGETDNDDDDYEYDTGCALHGLPPSISSIAVRGRSLKSPITAWAPAAHKSSVG